jgi:methylated-DNA-[protein]-cysteine S-methyltransferase
MTPLQWQMDSQIRPIYLVASATGLQGIFWHKQNVPMAKSLKGATPEVKILKQAVCELEEYFLGKRTQFNLPLEMSGTKFQKQVWTQLSKIPYGKTCSYKDVASRIKNPKAMRAVGTANGKNPFCIVIPCHRVIAADGSIGGYTGGLDIKVKLLTLEQNP